MYAYIISTKPKYVTKASCPFLIDVSLEEDYENMQVLFLHLNPWS